MLTQDGIIAARPAPSHNPALNHAHSLLIPSTSTPTSPPRSTSSSPTSPPSSNHLTKADVVSALAIVFEVLADLLGDFSGSGRAVGSAGNAERGDIADGGAVGIDGAVDLYKCLYLLSVQYLNHTLTPLEPISITLKPSSSAQTQPYGRHGSGSHPAKQRQEVNAYQRGIEMAKEFKGILEGMLDREEQLMLWKGDMRLQWGRAGESEVGEQKGGDKGVGKKGDLVEGCLGLCLAILAKTHPSSPLYSLSLEELHPTHLPLADSVISSLLGAKSDHHRSSRASHSRNGWQSHHTTSHGSSSTAASGSSSRSQHAAAQDPHISQLKHSFPSTLSFQSSTSRASRASLAPSFISLSPSMRSTFGIDGMGGKGSASVGSVSRGDAGIENANVDGLPGPKKKENGSGVLKGVQRRGSTSAEEMLRRQHKDQGSHIGSESGDTSGASHRPRMSSLTTTGSKANRWFSALGSGFRSSVKQSLPSPLSFSGEGSEPNSPKKRLLDLPEAEGNGLKKSSRSTANSPMTSTTTLALPMTPETSCSSLIGSPATSDKAHPTSSTNSPLLLPKPHATPSHLSMTASKVGKQPSLNRKPRAFESDGDAPLAPLDPRLAAAEMRSKLNRKGVCAVCNKGGVNFPSCRKCGDTFCSRECRIGANAGGDGQRHVCGIYETRLLARAAQSDNGQLLPSPPTIQPVRRQIST